MRVPIRSANNQFDDNSHQSWGKQKFLFIPILHASLHAASVEVSVSWISLFCWDFYAAIRNLLDSLSNTNPTKYARVVGGCLIYWTLDCWCENGNTCMCPLACMLICGFVLSLCGLLLCSTFFRCLLLSEMVPVGVLFASWVFPLVIVSVWQPWVCFYSSRVCISVHTNTAKRVNAALHQLQADGSLRGLMSRLKHDWFGEGCNGEIGPSERLPGFNGAVLLCQLGDEGLL